jgi:hypothetical protein
MARSKSFASCDQTVAQSQSPHNYYQAREARARQVQPCRAGSGKEFIGHATARRKIMSGAWADQAEASKADRIGKIAHFRPNGCRGTRDIINMSLNKETSGR